MSDKVKRSQSGVGVYVRVSVGVSVYVSVAVVVGVKVSEGVNVSVGVGVLELVGVGRFRPGFKSTRREMRNCSTTPRCAENRCTKGQASFKPGVI